MAARVPKHVREEQLNSLPGKKFIRWLDGEYLNNKSKAVMSCDNGHEWSASVDKLVSGYRGCPKCGGTCPFTPSERETQLNSIPNMKFVRWQVEYRNRLSKAVMICEAGHEWSASLNKILHGKGGCQKCAGKYRYSPLEREVQLNSLPYATFIRWVGQYKNCDSRAVMRCRFGHEWEASVEKLVNRGSGCPSCANYGFDQNKAGVLYALISECGGHIKVGISNDLKTRIRKLSSSTPFKFMVASTVKTDGKTVMRLERTIHEAFERSGFKGFDGATEWLKFNPDILSLLRILGA